MKYGLSRHQNPLSLISDYCQRCLYMANTVSHSHSKLLMESVKSNEKWILDRNDEDFISVRNYISYKHFEYFEYTCIYLSLILVLI